MRRYLVNTFLYFILPVVILAVSTEVLLRNIPNDYKYKREYLIANADKIEVLILGSSHSYRGVNPAFFSKDAFNLAYVSQPLFYDLKLFEKYSSDLKNLKTIFVPVSYFSLFSNIEDGKEAWRIKNYEIYHDLHYYPQLKYQLEILATDFDVSRRRMFSYYIQGKSQISCSPLGWGGGKIRKGNKKQILEETGLAAATRHTKNLADERTKSNFERNKTYLESLIKLAGELKVEVKLFMPPAYKKYINALDTEQYNLTIDVCQKFESQYSNCSFVSFLKDNRFVEDDFRDADHLNDEGATKFSKLLDGLNP